MVDNIKTAPLRTLSHVIGHSIDGKGGRQTVGDLLDGLVASSGSAVTGNLAVFSDSSGEVLGDSGLALSEVEEAVSICDFLSVTVPVDLDEVGEKVGHLTVTQPVDLDAMETRVNQLDAAVVLKGTWDASGGSFPGSGAAQAGDSWIVSTGGTVDGVVFTANDRLIAIADNASATTFAGNWFKADYTDAVLSVDGSTGTITIGAIIAAATAKATPVDADLFGLSDSAASGATKKVSWTNIKATLKTYFDTLYGALATANQWLKTQRAQVIEVDSASTITLDLSLGQVFRIKAPGLSHNATVQLSNASSYIGAKFQLTGYQNAGGNTLSYGTGLVSIGAASAPAIPTAAGAKFRMDGDIVASGEYHFTARGVGV